MTDKILARYREPLPKIGHAQACIQIATETGVGAIAISHGITLHEMDRGAGECPTAS